MHVASLTWYSGVVALHTHELGDGRHVAERIEKVPVESKWLAG